jgi:hypothetical protein
MGMARVSDPDLLVLVALRLRTLADLDTIAGATGSTTATTDEILGALAAGGLVRRRDGRVSGWMLTPQGRGLCGSRLSDELDASGGRDEVADAYDRFLTVNQRLLDLCTRWQLREVDGAEIANDHADADHDAAVLADLAEIDVVGQVVCTSLAAVLTRFDGYGARLATARDAAGRGEPDWLTRPTIDSYHTVWFELHENLLATLGLERGHEGAPDPSSLQEAH